MKIVHIVPGSGGTFYCENCLRDSELVQAQRRQGHDVVLVPMYLPLFLDDAELSRDVPVFFGAVNLYLGEKFAWFRRFPKWVERVLDSRRLLGIAAKKAGSTRAEGLEEMTLSMLKGENGRQAAELDKLLAWLQSEGRPDVVHLSNALLLGLAHRIRSELRTPVVCSLQDEDVWVDAMRPDYREQVWDMMATGGQDVDAFVAVSRYYAKRVREPLRIPHEKLSVVHVGLDLDGYEPAGVRPDPPAVGYLSRLAESMGLGILVDAFIRLRREPRFGGLRLRLTGGHTPDDRRFLTRIRRDLKREGLLDAVEFLPNFDRAGRQAFLRALSVLSVPVPAGEAFGTYLVEAMASGVPFVQPRIGAFPEIVERSGGGVLYEPNEPGPLAEALAGLLAEPVRARELGAAGRRAAVEHFAVGRMARDTIALYSELASGSCSRLSL